jgi:hypothetical protein
LSKYKHNKSKKPTVMNNELDANRDPISGETGADESTAAPESFGALRSR